MARVEKPNLTHVRLLVRDFPACFRFYRDVFGFNVTYGDEDDRYADFEAGDALLALFKRDLMATAVGAETMPYASEAGYGSRSGTSGSERPNAEANASRSTCGS